MKSYIARQPIFNEKVEIFAYELLFRSNDAESSFAEVDADQASSRVVMESFHTMGLERLTAGRPVFINFTVNLLLENIATLFPKDSLVIELLETIEPTEEIIAVCRSLRQDGYTLALDDFVYSPKFEPLIELCQIIKFDFLLTPPEEISEMLAQMNVKDKWLLAEKIETKEMFETAKAMGFTLFQGYFFSKPVTLVAQELAPLQIHYMTLMQHVNQNSDEMRFHDMAEIIRGDVALSYKLLRLVNSAYFGLRREITDIKHALVVLGTRELRKWIFMLAVMGVNTDKPDELIRMSMTRGRFMERMACDKQQGLLPENAFMTGLFSLLDALTDRPMQAALESIILPPEVREALEVRTGRLFLLLSLVASLERGDWETTDRLAAALHIAPDDVSDAYLEAVEWCDSLTFS